MWHAERARLALRILFGGVTVSLLGVAALSWYHGDLTPEGFAGAAALIVLVMWGLHALVRRATRRL